MEGGRGTKHQGGGINSSMRKAKRRKPKNGRNPQVPRRKKQSEEKKGDGLEKNNLGGGPGTPKWEQKES